MEKIQILSIGSDSCVIANRVLAIVGPPDSAPIRRMIREARERGNLIDATAGKKTAGVLVMDSDHVVLSSLDEKTLMQELKKTLAE